MTTSTDGLVDRLRALRWFLGGTQPLDGLEFGEAKIKRPGAWPRPYWWRSHLDRIDDAADRIEAQAARIAELEGALERIADEEVERDGIECAEIARTALRGGTQP